MNIKKSYFGLLLLMFYTMTINGQESINPNDIFRGDLQLTGKHYGDSIVLRWGFDHPEAWLYHVDKVVTIYRRDVTEKEEIYTLLETIKPWDSTRIENFAATQIDPGMSVIVLENLYRNWHNSSFESMGNIVEMSDNFFNRWSLVHFAADRDPNAAEAAGLRYVDHNIEEDHLYSYKVKGLGERIIQDYKVVLPKPTSVPIIYDFAEKDSLIEIYWEKLRHENMFSAYYFEESMDGTNWNRINETPFVQAFDANVKSKPTFYTFMYKVNDGLKHHLRMIGLDAFGDLSPPSITVVVQTKDKTPPPKPNLIADTAVIHMAIDLQWTIGGSHDLSHFDLERSYGGAVYVFDHWADKEMRSQQDIIIAGGLYKYRLIAVDSANNKSYSDYTYARGYDLTPPNSPSGLQAKADTNGVITLTWDNDPEKEVVGYYIYYSDGKKRNFTRLNGTMHRLRIYRDTVSLDMLNTKRYYTVAAINNNYLLSKQSEPIEVIRPDVIPPSPAFISDFLITNEGVKLKLQPSSSRDVVMHKILRQQKGTEQWEVLKVFDKVTPFYNDTMTLSGTSYLYRIIAVDAALLESKVIKDVYVTTKNAIIDPPKLQVEIVGHAVQIDFEDVNFQNEIVQLYKSKNQGPVVLIQKLKSQETFVDDQNNNGDVIEYYARTIAQNGSRSAFSPAYKISAP